MVLTPWGLPPLARATPAELRIRVPRKVLEIVLLFNGGQQVLAVGDDGAKLGVEKIDEETATDTINILLKYQSDITKAVKELSTADGVSV